MVLSDSLINFKAYVILVSLADWVQCSSEVSVLPTRMIYAINASGGSISQHQFTFNVAVLSFSVIFLLLCIALNILLVFIIFRLKKKQVNVLFVTALGFANTVASVASVFTHINKFLISLKTGPTTLTIGQCLLHNPYIIFTIISQDLNMHTLLALSLERMTSLCKSSWHNAAFTRRKVFSVLLIFICIVCVKVVCILNDVIRRSEIQVDRSCTLFLLFSPVIFRMLMFSYMVVIYFTALVYFSTCAVVRFKKRNMTTELRSMQLYREASLTRSFGLVLLFLIILQALPLTAILIDRGKTLPAEFLNYARTIRDIAWLVIPVIYFYSHPDINEQLVKMFPILNAFFSHKQKTAEPAVYIGDKSDIKKKLSS
ncbi:hypothetical protein T11_244 [Trichinella zimbabwensis]|uniref:G-protein coupled receptors family 1 profile domain-containing protein n=1 Tax=Trichinella zimbabwensis TaxID=268475 RepID=A0A0V1GZC4_9BILA|nr:hypothetical protein T11_244 [Trichinella zimbabwensis]